MAIAFKPEKKRVHAETPTTNKKAKKTEIKLAKAYHQGEPSRDSEEPEQ
jgi:hypothetical protein